MGLYRTLYISLGLWNCLRSLSVSVGVPIETLFAFEL